MKDAHVGSRSASADVDDDALNTLGVNPWGVFPAKWRQLGCNGIVKQGPQTNSIHNITVEAPTIIGTVAGYAVAPGCQLVWHLLGLGGVCIRGHGSCNGFVSPCLWQRHPCCVDIHEEGMCFTLKG